MDASIRKILEGPVGGSITVREVWQAYAGGVRQLSRTRADRREGAVTVQDGVVTRSVDVVTSGLSVSVEGTCWTVSGVARFGSRIRLRRERGPAGVNCSARIEAGEDYAIVCLDLSGNASAELGRGSPGCDDRCRFVCVLCRGVLQAAGVDFGGFVLIWHVLTAILVVLGGDRSRSGPGARRESP